MDEAGAMPEGAAEETPFSSGDERAPVVCVCAALRDGNNQMVHEWVGQQLCSGMSHVLLRDQRRLSPPQAAVARWMLEPWVAAGQLTLLPHTDDEPPPAPSSASNESQAAAGAAGAAGARWARQLGASFAGEAAEAAGAADSAWALLVGERAAPAESERRPPDASLREQCLASMGASVGRAAACERVALLEAPRETLLAEPGPASGPGPGPGPGPGSGPGPEGGHAGERQAVNGSCAVEGEGAGLVAHGLQRLPPRSLRLALTHLAEPEHAPPAYVPGRPLGATHVLRARSWGECRLRAAAAPARAPLCVAEADTVEVLLRHGSSAAWAAATTPPLLVPPSGAGLRALRYARLPVPQPAATAQPAGAAAAAAATAAATAAAEWVDDPVGALAQRRCEAAALELAQPGAAAAGAEGGGDEGGAEGDAEASGDGCGGAWSSWCAAAAAALESGEGATRLRGAMSRARAAAVRATLLDA